MIELVPDVTRRLSGGAEFAVERVGDDKLYTSWYAEAGPAVACLDRVRNNGLTGDEYRLVTREVSEAAEVKGW